MNRRMICALALLAVPFASGCMLETADLDPADLADLEEENVGSSADALSVFDWSDNQHILFANTSDAPALAAYRGEVHMVSTGYRATGAHLFHRIFDGSSWSEPLEIPGQRSKNQPALAALGSKGNSLLYMVHQGDTSDKLYWSFYDGTWRTNSQLPFTSDTPPVMAALDGKIHLFTTAYAGEGASRVYHRTFDGMTWAFVGSVWYDRPELNVGVASHNSSLVLVVRNDADELWMRTLTGSSWSSPSLIPGQHSKSAAALASFGGLLHMTHLGDTTNKIWWSTYDGTSWTNNVTLPNQQSKYVPGMAAAGGMLVQAHIGDTNPSLWYSTFQ